MSDAEDIALTIPEAFVYRIGPRTSAEGYKASDWTEQVAVVRVQVVTRGTDVSVKLTRNDTGKVFAIAPVRAGGPAAVEQVTDSSRYFALRIENGKGNHAFIGLGLNKREDAFDLKSCLADVSRAAEAEESGAGVNLGIDDVSGDLLSGLKAGQTFTIKVGAGGGAGERGASAAVGGARALTGGGHGRLAPPGTLIPPKLAAPTLAFAPGNGDGGYGGASSGGERGGVPTPAPTTSWETF